MSKFISKLIATCFGLGFLPFGPGTWTSVVAAIFWFYVRKSWGFGWPEAIVLILILSLLGWGATSIYEKASGRIDASEVVIDEWVGMGLAMLSFDGSLWQLGVAFVGFRILDIWKPGPIRYFDRPEMGALGTMLDDLFAGLIVCAGLGIFNYVR